MALRLFDGIFEEAEILAMDDEFFQSFIPLVNDSIANHIKEFFNEVDAERNATDKTTQLVIERADAMKEALRDVIDRMTFHFAVEQNESFNTIRSYYIDIDINTIKDKEKLLKNLNWIMENKHNLNGSIPQRKREDYERFYMNCEKLELRKNSIKRIVVEQFGGREPITTDKPIPVYISANKSFFYEKNEQKRPTHMSAIISKIPVLTKLQNGLEYQIECDIKGYTLRKRRLFTGGN